MGKDFTSSVKNKGKAVTATGTASGLTEEGHSTAKDAFIKARGVNIAAAIKEEGRGIRTRKGTGVMYLAAGAPPFPAAGGKEGHGTVTARKRI